jgi:hypothetical protein
MSIYTIYYYYFDKHEESFRKFEEETFDTSKMNNEEILETFEFFAKEMSYNATKDILVEVEQDNKVLLSNKDKIAPFYEYNDNYPSKRVKVF